jgi:DNA-binding NarL/FixJ family response regulator
VLNVHVSKQRPSVRGAVPGLQRSLPGDSHAVRPWLRRVFHNTYTRRGRRIVLRGWSVKIQFQGQRRTFSLAAPTRTAAAAEARAIHDAVASEGWEAVVRQHSGRQGGTFPKTDARYWRERLLLRNHPVPGVMGIQRAFSTRIDHSGTSCYFALGANEPAAAAAQALAIYRTAIEQGWDVVGRIFPREVTLSFHWARDPLLWTYTTVHTLVGQRLVPAARRTPGPGAARHILLIEADPGIRNALERCINQQEDYDCVPCPDPDTARRQRAIEGAVLCLVNHDLSERAGLPNSLQLATMAEGVPAVSYGVHLDSEELFALTPGGMSGYVLKRVPPHQILEPVLAVLDRSRVPTEELLQGVQSYFQRLLESNPAREDSNTVAELTRREQDVLGLLSKGYVDKEIAPALGISTWTVHEHVKRIFEKLQVHSRTEAVLAYLQK